MMPGFFGCSSDACAADTASTPATMQMAARKFMRHFIGAMMGCKSNRFAHNAVMRKVHRFLLPAIALCLVAGAKKSEFTVRFYAETTAVGADTFSTPMKFQYPAPHEGYVEKVPVINERDI